MLCDEFLLSSLPTAAELPTLAVPDDTEMTPFSGVDINKPPAPAVKVNASRCGGRCTRRPRPSTHLDVALGEQPGPVRQRLVHLAEVAQLLGRLVESLEPAGFAAVGQKLLLQLLQQRLTLVPLRRLVKERGRARGQTVTRGLTRSPANRPTPICRVSAPPVKHGPK